MKKHGILKVVSLPYKKTRFPANTVVFDRIITKVTPVCYRRTIMISPTEETQELSNLSFVDSCITIPANCDQIVVPYRVANVTDVSVTIQNNFPLFVIHPVNIPDHVTDPRLDTVSDEQFIDLFDVDFEGFSCVEADQIKRLLLRHKRLFALNDYQLGCLKDAKYHIELTDATPVKQRYRPIHPKIRDQVQQQLKVMLDSGVIQESTSPWSSPLTVAKKKDGSLRLCVDYRRLNAQAKRDAKSLPRIDETLSLLNGNRYFSSLDLIAGYWQLQLDASSKPLTAFSAGSEALYEFNRIPFGYSSSGMMFQRSIENVLRGLLYKHCLIYLDDILVKSTDFASHLDSMELVFDRLYEAGLRLKPKKCDLFSTKVKFLGYLITESGIRTDPDKTKLIEDWPTPTCTRDVRKYLGLISYYRKFVPNFSVKASALTQLLKGKLVKRGHSKMFVPVPFQWEHHQQKAFDELKHSLLKDVCLVHPDYSEPFVLGNKYPSQPNK